MESSRRHSIQLQFSMIQNEKDRLVDCILSTIEKGNAVAGVARREDLSLISRDNFRLLEVLMEWADAAERLLPDLYPCADGAARQPTVAPPATSDRLMVAPPPAISDRLTVAPTPAISDGLTVTPTPAISDRLTVAPPPAIADGLTVAPPPAMSDRLTVAPPPAMSDRLTVAPPPAMSDRLTVAPPPAISDRLTVAPPPAISDGLTVTPTPAISDGLTVTPTPAIADRLTVAPAPAMSDRLTVAPAPAMSDRLTVAPTPVIADRLTVAPPPAMSDRLMMPPPPVVSDRPAVDADTTVSSITSSFQTAADGTHRSSSAEAPLSRQPSTLAQSSDEHTVLNNSGTSLSRKSNGAASTILSRHLQKKRATPEPVKEKPLPALENYGGVPVMVSCCNDITGYTFLNLKEEEERLAKLTGKLTSLALQSSAKLDRTPSVGDLVMAAWSGAWYRARITEVIKRGDQPAMLTLHYIDYGNGEQKPASEVRFLPANLKSTPPAAYKCQLRNLKVGGVQHQSLQWRLLEVLVLGPTAQVTAIFHRTSLADLYLVELGATLQVAGQSRLIDVVAVLNNALELHPHAAALQARATSLDLVPLLVDFWPTAAAAATRVSPEVPSDEKVRGWLAAQTDSKRSHPSVPPVTKQSTRDTVGEVSFGGAGSEKSRSRPTRLKVPSEYAGLRLVWNARPLRRQPDGPAPLQDVKVLHVQAPDHFYISLDDHDRFDEFEKRLHEMYSALPLHPQQFMGDLLLVPGSYWVALFDGDKHWYRCVVQENDSGGQGDTGDYPVLWVDYGDSSRVHVANFRPMTEEFAAIPLFATRARCAGVYPVDEEGLPLTRYPDGTISWFRNFIQERPCVAYPVESESTADCLALLLETSAANEQVLVTDLLLRRGAVALTVPDPDLTDSPEPSSEMTNSPGPDCAEWDPMAEDYVSPFNRMGAVGPDDLGYRNGTADEPDQKICAVYARGARCWDGIACPYRHVRGGDQLPAQLPVYVGNADGLLLPRVDTTVYVKVSAARHPDCFHVQLPFGAVLAEEVNQRYDEFRQRLEQEETLESLTAAMTDVYSQQRRRDFSDACQPALGEIVVVSWLDKWHRGRVTDLTNIAGSDCLTAEVFLVDHGNTVQRDVTELKIIKKQYNLLPYQAVPCCLAYVAAPSTTGWSHSAVVRFVELLQQTTLLLATVLGVRPDGQLELDLYDAPNGHGHGCQPSHLLVQEGLAVPRCTRRPQPLRQALLPG